ncbi:MAG: tetratricopeptide repeat protein [Chlorobia bacterium]|nr:tetratricopeptide repeat protein [Fimbriimonadaceae bacterium]
MSDPLHISFFGPIQVQVDGAPLPQLRSRKALLLLSLLVLRNGKPAARGWLANTLWPDVDLSTALSSLRPVVSELRKALGPAGCRLQSADRNSIAFDVEGLEVDVLAFDEAVKAGDLESAIEKYSGPLLEGCEEDWAFQERRIRQEAFLSSLNTLADIAIKEVNPERAVSMYGRSISADPFRDSARRGLMKAHAASGSINAALQEYREYAHLLSRELGSAPEEETTDLYDRLRRETRKPKHVSTADQTPPSKNLPNNLPFRINGLIGREDEQIDVAGLLRKHRLVTLTGIGGIGKTELALTVAMNVQRAFPDGVWFLALEFLTDETNLSWELAAILKLKSELKESALDAIVGRLRGATSLLILDNCEHLLNVASRLSEKLLRNCPDLRILATSREPMGISGEAAWLVPPLPVPNALALPESRATRLRVVADYDSVQLFTQRARAVRPDFELTDENVLSVVEACVRLEGNPLAIELAAAKVRSMSPQRLAERLRSHHLQTLNSRSDGPAKRNLSIRATLDWSYELLSVDEQVVLRQLSVFSGGWSHNAAQYVLSESGIDGGSIEGLLESLIDKSLVVFDYRRDRFRLHELVRQYSLEKLENVGEGASVRSRLRNWVRQLAEEGEPHLKGTDPREWLQLTVAENDNIRSVLSECIRKGDPQQIGLRIAGALFRFWRIRGGYREAGEFILRTLDLDAAKLPTAPRAKALYGLAVVATRQADYPMAKAFHSESLEIWSLLGDQAGVAESFVGLGAVAFSQRESEEAAGFLDQALRIYVELGDRLNQARTLAKYGTIRIEQSDNRSARSIFEESLVVSRELGDVSQIAWALFNLGLLASDRNDTTLARVYFDECLIRFDQLGEQRGFAWALKELGVLEREECDPRSAREVLEQSRGLFEELRDGHGMAWCQVDLALVSQDEGQPPKARALLLEVLAQFKALGENAGIAYVTWRLGNLARHEGDLDAASSLCHDAMKLAVEWSQKLVTLHSLEELAMIALGRGHFEEAIRCWGAACLMRKESEYLLTKNQKSDFEPKIDAARSALGEDAFQAGMEWSRSYSWREAAAILGRFHGKSPV